MNTRIGRLASTSIGARLVEPRDAAEPALGYRDHAWPTRLRLAARLAAMRRAVGELAGARVDLAARRLARIVAGTAGVALALAMFGTTALRATREADLPLVFLGAAGPLALLAYAAGRLLGPSWIRRALCADLVVARRSPRDQLAHLEELGSPRALLGAKVAELEPWSIALPMMALSLLAPLTLHALVAAVAGWMDDYTIWIAASAAIVGHAHLVLAIACAHFAFRMKDRDPAEDPRRGWVVWAIAIAVSAVPGVVFLAIPPALTAVTGLIFIPAMFGWARRTVAAERLRLAI
jgi:hypothetical protein